MDFRGIFNKYALLGLGLCQLALFLAVKNDPFHGDAVGSTARAALSIYGQHLKSIWYPAIYDPGHPTLFPYLVAVFWTILGKSLWLVHLLNGVICFLILCVTRKLALYLSDAYRANLATVLVAIYSVCVAQSAMLLNTPLFFLMVLLALYFLTTGSYTWFILASIGMELTHLQANFFLLAFAGVYLAKSISAGDKIAKIVGRGMLLFLPALAVFSLWSYAHFHQFGWSFLSPNYTEHDHIKGVAQFIQSVFLIIWRLVDNGMWAVYGLFVFFLFKKQVPKQWLIFSSIVLGVNVLCMAVFLYNSIGHRYFMISQIMFILLVIMSAKNKQLIWVSLLIFVNLVFGNWMVYPGKVVADTNLQYRAYFGIEKRIATDYPHTVFYSYAPISSGADVRYLDQKRGLHIKPLNEVNWDTVPALLQSNVNAEFTKPMRDFLGAHWYGNTYSNGQVYVNVFLNPKYYTKPQHFQLRERGWFEEKLQELKYRIRGE